MSWMRLLIALAASGIGTLPAFASPRLTFSFVRRHEQCLVPDRTGASPLSFPACTAQPSPAAISFGPRAVNFTNIVLQRDAAKQPRNILLKSIFRDVRDGADGAGPGFNGILTIIGSVRATFSVCSDGGPGCTLVDLPGVFPFFPLVVPCGSAATPALPAGECRVETSVNAGIAGAVGAGGHLSIEITDLQVYFDLNGQPVFTQGYFF